MADDSTSWVACDEDCEQGALGFTGAHAWKAGVPKPLTREMAAHLAGGEGSHFTIVPDPNATPVPEAVAPLSDEALTPPAEAAPSAEGSTQS